MIDYTLTRKKNMKRLVLRVKNGVVCVSAPYHAKKADIDKFVNSKVDWINKQLSAPPVPKSELKHFDDGECLAKFEKLAEKIYPLIANKIKTKPKMFVKDYIFDIIRRINDSLQAKSFIFEL